MRLSGAVVLMAVRAVAGYVLIVSNNDTFADKPAAFGPAVQERLTAMLIPSDYANARNVKGCLPFVPPLAMSNGAVLPWIALVERGQCSFVDKVRAMQQSGAVGVVVGDNEKGGLITMYGTGNLDDIAIPSVFVAQWSYRDLKYQAIDAISANRALLVSLVRDRPDSWPLVDVLIITIVAPIVLVLFIYSLYRFRASTISAQSLTLESETATEAQLARLPKKIYSAQDRDPKDPETCAICLDDFVDGDEVRRLLSCRHEFHVDCIDPWLLTRKRTCPICKSEAVPPQSEVLPQHPSLRERLHRWFRGSSTPQEDIERPLLSSDRQPHQDDEEGEEEQRTAVFHSSSNPTTVSRSAAVSRSTSPLLSPSLSAASTNDSDSSSVERSIEAPALSLPQTIDDYDECRRFIASGRRGSV